MWVVVLKLGAAGGRSHTLLGEHSYHFSAAGPGRETRTILKEEVVVH